VGGFILGVCRVWDQSSKGVRDFVARHSAATDKLLKPPQGGGKSKEKHGFRSMERWLRSRLRQIPAIPVKFSEEEMVFMGRRDRLPGGNKCRSDDFAS
jgi:hypothetical protein